ncbi:uncharacterized protein BDZ99DRAFT_437889 [Mytilinidion resinicola]|uniref:BTB domain-containing protein n=1 Tax=Mytilinidion resinicola TaxID=574789 RepID=A0A6A6YWB2_9PEZI|nr:uncharacterized protein BDZ99DRAFT_437889 [Mytilinidion resinicola]KAF2813060.1 hypothetical protein BDZ99DRAFT_437889 [Mytilinidion resinicola]
MAATVKFKMPTDLKECPHKTEFPPLTAWDYEVSINVGKQKKEFRVFKGLLTYYSSYFAAALNGSFKEGVTQVVELEEDKPEVFEAFKRWMYNRRLRDQDPTPSWLKSTKYHQFLCEVFVFGDMRGIPGLKNMAIDQLHRATAESWVVPNDAIKYVYDNTPESSALRSFILCIYRSTLASVKAFMEHGKDHLTIDFIFDLLNEVDAQGGWKGMSQLSWARMDRCQWHDHSSPGEKLPPTSKDDATA